ncbi:hypothetical protein GF327_00655 [Candidatus Woesearchaeota archaeon]|nr:hypothetical protein [Candidatus Woesearchaeota archaeon]
MTEMAINLRSEQKENIYRAIRKIRCLIFPLLIPLFLFFVSRMIFFISLFIFLDLVKSYIEFNFRIRFFPVYFLDIGIILCSYVYSPFIGMIIVLFLVINRIVFADLKKRHFIKIMFLLIICFLTNLLNNLSILLIGPLMFVLRYVMEYTLQLVVNKNIDLRKFPDRIINSLVNFVIFYNLGEILVEIMG